MAKTTVQMRLDDDLLARVDAAREPLHQTRTAFVTAALVRALAGTREVEPRFKGAKR